MSDQNPGKAEPPYPGWSAEQPPAQPPLQDRPGDDWQSPGGGPGWQTPAAGPGTSAVGESVTAPSAGPAAPGWGAAPQWGWARPQVKPGVIPLRPLGVGEILDGAITTIRKNLGAMLGLSVGVAVLIQLVGLYFNWTMFKSLNEFAALPANTADDVLLDVLGTLSLAGAVYVFLDWLGRTILTGILTVVVSRAVLGETMSAGEAWRRARPRLLRVVAVTIVYALIAAGPMVAAVAAMFGLAAVAGAAGAVIGVLLIIASVPISIWLAIRYVLAPPIVMIETIQPPNGGPVPIGVVGSLRRSATLVRTSWWRVLGIYLLIWIIAAIAGNALSFVFSIPAAFADPFEGIGFTAVLLLALGGVLATAITAPFVAASLALLYVDRRIRAEGLDIELARAAGVTIPGRTDVPPTGSAL